MVNVTGTSISFFFVNPLVSCGDPLRSFVYMTSLMKGTIFIFIFFSVQFFVFSKKKKVRKKGKGSKRNRLNYLTKNMAVHK